MFEASPDPLEAARFVENLYGGRIRDGVNLTEAERKEYARACARLEAAGELPAQPAN